MPTVPLVLSSLLVLVIICCVVLSICCVTDKYPVCGGIFCGLAILSAIMLYKIANYESQYEWVLKNKPKCLVETVECLTDELEWVHDSIKTASRLSPERLKIINTVNSSDSAHIQLIKANLNYLRNQNKKEN